MSRLKLSMACWLIADEEATRRKIAAARRLRVPLVTGGGPFEIAQDRQKLEEFLDLCASLGIERIEAGEGFTRPKQTPEEVVRLASSRGLSVQVELGEKHAGAFDHAAVKQTIARGRRWLDAGAAQIVVEGRESAQGVGLYDENGVVNFRFAEAFVDAWGLDTVIFETPTKKSQFEFLSHFGNRVYLSNIRLEEVLRVEIYRRGLHSDAYGRMAKLTPPGRAA